MSSAFDISSYSFSSADRLLLDANIWLYLLGPYPPTDRRVRLYSPAFSRMVNGNSSLFVSMTILSEFINSYARIEHRRMRPSESSNKYKSFRDSADFKPIAFDIAIASREILNQCDKVDEGFQLYDIDSIINEYETGTVDFNDQVTVRVCT